MRAPSLLSALAFGAGLAGCSSCRREAAPAAPDAASPTLVAEVVPRCRAEAAHVTLTPDVVVGEAAIGDQELLLGLVRVDGGRHVASVLRAPLDLASSRTVDVGPSFGDDPPPAPRLAGGAAWVLSLERVTNDAGALRQRVLRVAHLEGKVETSILQQADESTAFDAAWSDGGALVAWDEDAPARVDAGQVGADRGFVKVQTLAGKVRVASPESSDAESPRLLARPGGFWLAWLARRPEEELYGVEGPGEPRAYRWVEVVPLDASGEPAGPLRRVGSEKGRAVSFELARSGADLVVLVQDEAAPSEGAGARVVRHLVPQGGKVEAADVVDGGVGHAISEVAPAAGASPWLAWNDVAERAHLTPLGPGAVATAPATLEPALDRARVVAAGKDGTLYAVVVPDGAPAELRRFTCRSLPLPSGAAFD